MNQAAGAVVSLPEAEDFRTECQVLYDVLGDVPASFWCEPTGFKGWTAYDVIGHLYMFDQAALVALQGEAAFTQFTDGYRHSADHGGSRTQYTRQWLGAPPGSVLLEQWRRHADALADLFRELDPRQRLPWGRGPGMSARSLISARQMESWAHGQAVFDLAGRQRQEGDRLRNIAVLGVNTCDWAFRNRGLEPPPEKPRVDLVCPSGAHWTWNDVIAGSSITGSAVEFCQVVTQTRNVADTQLAVHGEAARAWMTIAQCFAGPPHDPPAPGARTISAWCRPPSAPRLD